MEVVYQRCCGLDVHKRSVAACVITPEGKETRTFGTMTKDILQLADWLEDRQVTHVAMESTGVFWKPVYNLLEGAFTALVVNAQHIKAVPGRKTDVRDAEWIADLLRHGLVRASFIPNREQRELRELVRHRRSLVEQRAQGVNRIQKVLEGANIKLASVVSDIMGASGRAMLNAMVLGQQDPAVLAGLAKGKLAGKREALAAALRGRITAHQRLLLESLLRQVDFLDTEIDGLSEEVSRRMSPFEEVIQRLDEVPGLGRRTVEQVVAETGLDMSQFPTAEHLASWARLCPGNNESAGKRHSGRTGHANRWLKSALVDAAWAASRARATYFAAQYHRIAARRGKKRAIIAVAHAILVTIYHMIRHGSTYRDLGADYFDQRSRESIAQNAVRRLHRLGYTVAIQAPTPTFS